MSGSECRGLGLLPNLVHPILVPEDQDGLRRALSKVHRVYAGTVHAREKRTGHFWQGRFGAVAMDEAHLAAAVRYVLLNPVRARFVSRAVDWPWSSVHAHLSGAGDGVTSTKALRVRFPDLAGLLGPDEEDDASHDRLRRAESVDRPLADPAFLEKVEAATNRQVTPRKRGPTPKSAAGAI